MAQQYRTVGPILLHQKTIFATAKRLQDYITVERAYSMSKQEQSAPRGDAPASIGLPFRATTAQACHWLARQTGTAWSLARLIEHGLQPSVWLDYGNDQAASFGHAYGGYAVSLGFGGDTWQLAATSGDVLITITQGSHQIMTTLRFLKRDVERLAAKLMHADALVS